MKKRNSGNQVIQIITTGDSKDLMERIGRCLVEKRLASCAQIGGPIKSIYRWKENIEEAEEWTCTLKSTQALYREIEAEIKSLHTYKTPEIIAFAIDQTLPEYRNWVTQETSEE